MMEMSKMLCQLIIHLLPLILTNAANPTLRKLNSKINLIRTGFQREIDELKYNVLDLSTELDIERHRNDELERKLNETLEKVETTAAFGVQVSGANGVNAEKLDADNAGNKAINVIRGERIKQLEKKLTEEKEKRMALEVEIESIREKCSILDTHRDILQSQQMIIDVIRANISTIASDNKELDNRIQSTESSLNESKEIWSTTEDFQSSLRLAFREEKHFVRNLTRGLQKHVHLAIEDIKVDINTTISELRRDIIGLQNNASDTRRCCETFEELDDRVSEADHSIKTGTTVPNQSTTRLPTSTSKEQDILSLSPVTLQPGGPAILPLYEEDLAKAIKLGSRVVRGRDWAWGDQDGTPPGPGTVDGWVGGDRTSGQVYVKWDRGTRANYRIGALGKYDLYLLPDENRFEIQPIFGSDLEKAIKIGSRVVRGQDWSWGDQDGIPPTPGTVIRWYGNDQSSKQVMVRWDSGKTVNYRVGAHGKYDLYLIKDQ